MLALTTTVEMTLPPKMLPSSAGECAVVEQWVDQNLDHLPTTYDEFAKYPVTYRKMIYTRLPLQTRAEFWREHLDRFMAAHDLNPAQAALVQTIRANISEYLEPDFYTDNVIYARAQTVLGVQLTKDAFMNLVPLSSADLAGEACSCSSVHGSCPGGYGCKDTGCDPVACGFLGHDTCNGTCQSPT